MTPEQAEQELLAQTAKIHWHELEKFFAAGKIIAVDPTLDLIKVGTALIEDNTSLFEQWAIDQKVQPASDKQAIAWSKQDRLLWACVVSPWVLVQTISQKPS